MRGSVTGVKLLKLAAGDSRTSSPICVAADGPLLLRFTVYVRSCPTCTGLGEADIVTATSLGASVRVRVPRGRGVFMTVRITAGETARLTYRRGSPLPSAGTIQTSARTP